MPQLYAKFPNKMQHNSHHSVKAYIHYLMNCDLRVIKIQSQSIKGSAQPINIAAIGNEEDCNYSNCNQGN